MQLPVQITFRDMEASHRLEAEIQKRANKLETFYDRITSCRVIVECPHQSQTNGQVYNVRIDLTVPGQELVVSRTSERDQTHENVLIAIRDAFHAVEKQLKTHADKRRP